MENYNKKSIWKWILLYVLLAAVAYGLVYYFFFYNKENNSYVPQNYQEQTQNFPTQNNPAPSAINVTFPIGGESWKMGEVKNITWNPGLLYDIGCHNFITLEDASGKVSGVVSDGLLVEGQTSTSWNAKDMKTMACGTGAEFITVKPGTYRIKIVEQGNGGDIPDIIVYSNYFNIVQ